ncbi:MAG: UPF0280 family protein [Elusimicrobia bacterium]|nr:UPF0280 family protein [Elusimicrobiota bacterium]
MSENWGINQTHFYRLKIEGKNSFSLKYKNSDIFVKSDRDIKKQVEKILAENYDKIEEYISANPHFAESLVPLPEDDTAPEIAKKMFRAAKTAGVGPMAAVAGAIAEEIYIGLKKPPFLIVENGGDIFLSAKKDVLCGIFSSTKFDKFALKIKKSFMPCGISSSSSKIGHSLSFGKAVLATVISKSGAAADAFATALANKIQSGKMLKKAVEETGRKKEVIGCFAILDEKIAISGDIEFLNA